MSQAYYCDLCGELAKGRPPMEVDLNHAHIPESLPDTRDVLKSGQHDVCYDCVTAILEDFDR